MVMPGQSKTGWRDLIKFHDSFRIVREVLFESPYIPLNHQYKILPEPSTLLGDHLGFVKAKLFVLQLLGVLLVFLVGQIVNPIVRHKCGPGITSTGSSGTRFLSL